MQVTETQSEGLKREIKIVVPSSEMETEVESRLVEMSKTLKMKGFRPGKVPMAIVRRQYRPSIMGEVLEKTVQTKSQEALTERDYRPAMQPKITIDSFDEGKDLAFTMDLELLPEFELGDLSTIEATRLTAEVTDEVIDDALQRVAEGDKQFEKVEEARESAEGDQLILDFKAVMDGAPLEGSDVDDFELVLGGEGFLPEFSEQLTGAKAGEHRKVSVTFPDDYPREEYAGKTAEFSVDIKEIKAPVESKIDDELAKRQGAEDLEGLRTMIREHITGQYTEASDAQLKRTLLDILDSRFTFDVPQTMVEQEFAGIWEQVKGDVEKSGGDFEKALGQTEEAAEADYRGIAARRVKLGLVLSEIGQQNKIAVERDDLLKAALDSVRGMPNPQQVLEFYRSNPNALDRFRAPVFEDKVVAFLTEMAKLKEETVTPEELFRDPDAEAEADAEVTEKKPAAKKKAKPAAKKAKSDKPAAKAAPKAKAKTAAKKKPAAKTATKKAEDKPESTD